MGQLAAAAISCASSTAELIDLGIDAIRVAFCLGLRTYQVGHAISGAVQTERSWTEVVNLNEKAVSASIEDFLEESVGQPPQTVRTY